MFDHMIYLLYLLQLGYFEFGLFNQRMDYTVVTAFEFYSIRKILMFLCFELENDEMLHQKGYLEA